MVQHVDLPDKWQQEQERRRFFVTFRARQYSEASFVNTHPIPHNHPKKNFRRDSVEVVLLLSSEYD